MLRTLLAGILALAVSTAGAQIVNRPVAAGSISNPGTSLPATCAVGYVYFKSNSTAGQNLHLCTAANTWTQLTGGNLANPVTPAQGGSGVANSKNLTWSASLTLAGTDATTMTFPTTSATIARTDAANTFTGNQTFSGNLTSTSTTPTLSLGGTPSANGGALLQLTATNTQTNWQVSQNTFVVGALELTPSTAGGGTTFTTPLWTMTTALNTVKTPLLLTTGATANQLRTAQTTTPTCTVGNNCGTGGGTILGTDTAGILTLGTTPASGFVITFNGTWASAPACLVEMYLAGMVVGKQPLTVATTTTTLTVVTNGTAPATGDKYVYHCIGVS